MRYQRISGLCLAVLLAGCAANQSVSQGPSGANALNVADAALAGGDPATALRVSQSVLASDPGSADALVHEGNAYYALDRYYDASAAYHAALKIDPHSSDAQTGLGRSLLKSDPAAAAAAFELATNDNPGNAAAWNDLGIAEDLSGNAAGSIEAYRRALAAQPGFTAAEVNLGLALALSGHADQALQFLAPLAVEPGSTPKIREDYAVALIASGRDSQASQVLSVDMPPDEVARAILGYKAVIAGSQPPLTESQATTAPQMSQPAQPAASAAAPVSPVTAQPLFVPSPAPAASPVVTPPVPSKTSLVTPGLVTPSPAVPVEKSADLIVPASLPEPNHARSAAIVINNDGEVQDTDVLPPAKPRIADRLARRGRISIGAHTSIGYGATIGDNVVIGQNNIIGARSRISNARLGDKVVVSSGAIIGQ
jgi:Flp pilus assembly protein TadD